MENLAFKASGSEFSCCLQKTEGTKSIRPIYKTLSSCNSYYCSSLLQIEDDLQQTIESQALDQDNRYKQLKEQMEQERQQSDLALQDKGKEIERLSTQIHTLEIEINRLKTYVTEIEVECRNYETQCREYEEQMKELREKQLNEDRASTTLLLETRARPEEKHISTSKLRLV